MPRPRKPAATGPRTADYRHQGSTRKNNPPAKIASEGKIPKVEPVPYAYSPHLPPVLRFDPDGDADKLPRLLEKARTAPLSEDDVRLLSQALRTHEPWLEWSGKAEEHRRRFFEVDPVALHIHERVSTQAILNCARRTDVARDLFADPELEYREAVKFYQHDVDWANRLILGDSLEVMSSLATRENLAGKVQMIYMDPPYGIKFASNFQPLVGKRDVKDKEQDLTREPEMVKAYRDTWHLGVHSYLSYLRDRLIVARELLADTGSIFVQISDENLHLILNLMDEVFGPAQFCSLITFRKKMMPLGSDVTEAVSDYLLWYSHDRARVKLRPLFRKKDTTGDAAWSCVDLPTGERRRLTSAEVADSLGLPPSARIFQPISLLPAQYRPKQDFAVEFNGRLVQPPKRNCWKTDRMDRVVKAERAYPSGDTLRQVLFHDDYPVSRVTNLWDDTGGASDMRYVVQTSEKIITRCLLMTTDPGDLVLDPTCGSGTTAYVAEQWGRRWITTDTSRVALAIARQRLLTAKYDYYRLRDREAGVAGNLVYKTVPHITLKSIAQNRNLDPIFAKHEPILDARLSACNDVLPGVKDALRRDLAYKLSDKQKREGKTAVTDADRRRWELPKSGARWEHWQVPFDTDPAWPQALQEAVTAYRAAWRTKMDEVNGCISRNADQEELVDQPEVERGIVRVSGPFTVEGVIPAELTLGTEGLFGGAPESLRDGDGDVPVVREPGTATADPSREVRNIRAYLRDMLGYLKADGVRFTGNRQMRFSVLQPTQAEGVVEDLHAEGRWLPDGETDTDPDGRRPVAVAFGPQHGPITAMQVEQVIRAAARAGYDELVVAGFSFDAEAAATIEESGHPKLRVHMAHIRPDINPGMRGLLKTTPNSQLFTVFGLPQVELHRRGDEWVVDLHGVDIYDPVENVIRSTGAEKVAAWFLDSDYDGRTFCITQAFFPDQDAWEKLARALKGAVDEAAFAAFGGTESLPFKPGKHGRVAVKVVDPRGNEVMVVKGWIEQTNHK